MRFLKRSIALGKIACLAFGPSVEINPRNFRSCGLATAFFVSFTSSFSLFVDGDAKLTLSSALVDCQLMRLPDYKVKSLFLFLEIGADVLVLGDLIKTAKLTLRSGTIKPEVGT
jgi:hypothetical protein